MQIRTSYFKQLLMAGASTLAMGALLVGCLPQGGGLFPSASTSGLVEATVESSFWDNFNRIPSHMLIQFTKDCGTGAVPEGVAASTSETLKLTFDPNCNYTQISMHLGTMNGNNMDADASTSPGREISLLSSQLMQYIGQTIPLRIPLSDIKGIFKTSTGGTITPTPIPPPTTPNVPTQPTGPQTLNVTTFVVGGPGCHNCEIFEAPGSGQFHVMQQALAAGNVQFKAPQATKIFYNDAQNMNLSASMVRDIHEHGNQWPAIVAFNSQGIRCFSQKTVHNVPGQILADRILTDCK